jgi:hypothetical protein
VPAFEKHWTVATRGVRAFLDLRAGLTRAGAASEPFRADQNPQLNRSRAGTGIGNLSPENMVWIFGTGRSGNTWLTAMMESAGHAVWREPAIGDLFGDFYYRWRSRRRNAKFVLGDPSKDIWLGSIRRFVLEGANGRFPWLSGEDYLVLKEQVGSVGASLLSEALPESKMIFLIRDPRDVVASWLDGATGGGWHQESVARRKDPERASRADEDPTTYVKQQARRYRKQVGHAAEAYDAHEGKKVLVRYEELRADALGTMRRIHSELGMVVDEARLRRAVEEHSWENIPEREKGEGKFHRKASPGSWKEDLTPRQAKAVERITAPLIEQYYPG